MEQLCRPNLLLLGEWLVAEISKILSVREQYMRHLILILWVSNESTGSTTSCEQRSSIMHRSSQLNTKLIIIASLLRVNRTPPTSCCVAWRVVGIWRTKSPESRSDRSARIDPSPATETNYWRSGETVGICQIILVSCAASNFPHL